VRSDRSRDWGPQAALAYARYSARALLRFDLDGHTETIRQLQERIAIGEHTMSAQLLGMVARERNRELELEAATERRAPTAGKPR